ncbi:MAG: hypothetical protein K940chlam2_01653 [Chlamydiae bacterium]|nr:hypothetical protein [Chlamydiota bacterium]
MGNHYFIYALEEYREWFDAESEKSRYQVQNRISRVENSGHFGSIRSLKKQLWELKFNDGRRIQQFPLELFS